jgi:hypothetical protein
MIMGGDSLIRRMNVAIRSHKTRATLTYLSLAGYKF